MLVATCGLRFPYISVIYEIFAGMHSFVFRFRVLLSSGVVVAWSYLHCCCLPHAGEQDYVPLGTFLTSRAALPTVVQHQRLSIVRDVAADRHCHAHSVTHRDVRGLCAGARGFDTRCDGVGC